MDVSAAVVSGYWYAGRSSHAHRARLCLDQQAMVQVQLLDGSTSITSIPTPVAFNLLRISPRLGNTPRFVYFDDGSKFETLDNDKLDQWVRQHSGSSGNSGLRHSWRHKLWLHRLESHWQAVLLSLIVVVAFAWAIVRFGVPAAAQEVALVLPAQLSSALGEQTLKAIDEYYLQPSQLSEPERQRLLKHFQPLLNEYRELNLRVVFRDGSAVGANAFALPDGTIVFTDQMIALAADNNELLAVLAHEVGHVAHRHGLQTLVRGSLMSAVLMFMTGDVSAASSVFVGAPLLLLEMSNSRHFERQADDFSLKYMADHRIEPYHFVNLMMRLEDSHRCLMPATTKTKADTAKTTQDYSAESKTNGLACYRQLADGKGEGGSDSTPEKGSDFAANGSSVDTLSSYLSSHPPTAERLQKFRSQ